MGFGQAYYLIFMSYETPDENPIRNPVESILQVYQFCLTFLLLHTF